MTANGGIPLVDCDNILKGPPLFWRLVNFYLFNVLQLIIFMIIFGAQIIQNLANERPFVSLMPL